MLLFLRFLTFFLQVFWWCFSYQTQGCNDRVCCSDCKAPWGTLWFVILSYINKKNWLEKDVEAPDSFCCLYRSWEEVSFVLFWNRVVNSMRSFIKCLSSASPVTDVLLNEDQNSQRRNKNRCYPRVFNPTWHEVDLQLNNSILYQSLLSW